MLWGLRYNLEQGRLMSPGTHYKGGLDTMVNVILLWTIHVEKYEISKLHGITCWQMEKSQVSFEHV